MFVINFSPIGVIPDAELAQLSVLGWDLCSPRKGGWPLSCTNPTPASLPLPPSEGLVSDVRPPLGPLLLSLWSDLSLHISPQHLLHILLGTCLPRTLTQG